MPDGQSIDDVAALVTAAGEALSAGRWEEARAGFERILEIEECQPDAMWAGPMHSPTRGPIS